MRAQSIKKILVLSAITTASLLTPFVAQAQGAEEYLAQIATNTSNTNNNVTQGNSQINSTLGTISGTANSILGALNTQIQNFQQYYIATIYPNLYDYLQSWLASDDTQATAGFQSAFSSLGQLWIAQLGGQDSVMPQVNNSLFGTDSNANKNTLWYANDLTYSTILGTPYFSPDPRAKKVPGLDPGYNYVLNASGAGINHVRPYTNPTNPKVLSNWTGAGSSRQKYQNYYNTVMAVESYNAYILGNQYLETKNGGNFTKLQTQLITQATDAQNWFAQVAGKESLGQILRQILLFDSQSYILMSQLIQTQKQLLTAQVMTNALLIATNVDKEYVMQSYAQGQTPTL